MSYEIEAILFKTYEKGIYDNNIIKLVFWYLKYRNLILLTTNSDNWSLQSVYDY